MAFYGATFGYPFLWLLPPSQIRMDTCTVWDTTLVRGSSNAIDRVDYCILQWKSTSEFTRLEWWIGVYPFDSDSFDFQQEMLNLWHTHTQWPVATYGWIVTSLLQYIAMYKVRLEMLNHCVRVLLMCTYGDIVGIANELHNACRCLNWDTNYTLHNYHVVGKLLVAPGYPYLYIIGKTDTGNNLSSKPISTNPTG